MNYKDNPIANAYVAMYETKKVKREAWVPESIKDEGVADFMGAAAAAAKAGKKEFKFGDKTYKVTMKKDTVDAINDAVEVCEKCGKVHEGSCSAEEVKEGTELDEISSKTLANYIKKSGKDMNVQINRSKKASGSGDTKNAKDASRRFKSRMKGQEKATDKLINKTADSGIERKKVKRPPNYNKEVAEPQAKGEKDFKDMHTKNTKKSGEKDDGTQIQEAVKINKEPFKGTKAEANVDRILTRAGFVYGKKPDALSFEEPAHTDPKTGNRVVIMSRGKQFAVSNAKGDTIQGPTSIAISMDPLFKWLEANKYKIR